MGHCTQLTSYFRKESRQQEIVAQSAYLNAACEQTSPKLRHTLLQNTDACVASHSKALLSINNRCSHNLHFNLLHQRQ